MMRKSEVKRKKIRIPIYDVDLWVLSAPSIREGFDRLPRIINAEWIEGDNDCRASFYYNHPNYAIVFDSAEIGTGIVHHEVGHAVRQLMFDIGYKIDPENDEPVSYLEEWLNKQVHDAL